MGVTFDGANRVIVVDFGTTSINLKTLYSDWKEWAKENDNVKHAIAFSSIGGDQLATGLYLGSTFFLENGWKIRPHEASHVLVVDGNLYSRDGSSPFVQTLGSHNVTIQTRTSNLIDTVATAGSSPTDNAAAVLDGEDSVESGMTVRQALRLMSAVLAGKVTGAGSGVETFRAATSDHKDRVVVTVTPQGNRTDVDVDLT